MADPANRNNPGARPVAFDVDRGRLTYHPARHATEPGLPAVPSRNRSDLAALVAAADTTTTRWAVTSLDGGVGRSTVAVALAGLLASGAGHVLLVDGNPSPWPAVATTVGVAPCPAVQALQDPRPWPEWIPKSPSGVFLLTGSAPGYPSLSGWDLQRLANLTGAVEFRHIITDWPAGTMPAVAIGYTLLVARADAGSLERVVQLLNAGVLDPSRTTLVLNEATTVADIDRRARTLTTALEGRVDQLVHLRRDKALAAQPYQPTKLAAATATALTQILTKGTHR